MDFTTFTAAKDDNDRRLDKIIRKFISEESLSGIYSSIRKGLVKLNDKKTDASTHVFTGDKIKIASFLLSSTSAKSNAHILDESTNTFEKLNIIFQNEHILIINKPYDIAVHGFQNSLEKQVLEYYNTNIKKKSLSFKPGPLHRLDKKTTGLLAFSMSLEGARWFSENIANHTIQKEYIGLIQGILSEEETWMDYISKEDNSNEVFHTVKVSTNQNNSLQKKAVTKVIPIRYGRYKDIDVTLAKFIIQTGRTHQIRSQSSTHNHPLLGDIAYNGIKIQEKQDFFLHARNLIIVQNNLNIPPLIQAPFPKNFTNLLKELGIEKLDK